MKSVEHSEAGILKEGGDSELENELNSIEDSTKRKFQVLTMILIDVNPTPDQNKGDEENLETAYEEDWLDAVPPDFSLAEKHGVSIS